MYRHYFYCSISFRCIIIQDAQSYSENSGTGGTLWRNPNELSQNTEVIICQHTSRYCFCPVIIGRFPIFPAEAFIFITVWRLGSVIPTAVRWRSTEKNRLSMPEMSPFFPAMFHIPLTVHQARKATGLIFSWIRRNCSAISSPPPGKITTCPRTVSQHSVIFSAKRLFPTSTIWYLISSTSWKSRIPAIRSVPEACYAPFILNCTGLKVSAVSIPTRPNRTLLKYWPYRNVRKKARSPKTLW